MQRSDWVTWHRGYDQPGSALAGRLRIVRRMIGAAFDERRTRPIRVLSMCAGEGRDIVQATARHPARDRVTAHLVELFPTVAAAARDNVARHRLQGFEVIEADAGATDTYVGLVPADLVLACGIFGNVPDQDVYQTVDTLPQLTAEHGVVIWTRQRRAPDLTPAIRDRLRRAGFAEVEFVAPHGTELSVGRHRHVAPAPPLQAGRRIFTFIR